jgi:hypothetical protein
MTNTYDLCVGTFVRGLVNLSVQLTKAEQHAKSSGLTSVALLEARLGGPIPEGASPNDLHRYTLSAHVHWAAEGAKLAVANLLGEHPVANINAATNFAGLYQQVDAAIAQLRAASSSELETGLDREVVIQHRRGTSRAPGRQFLIAFAIPHFFYHVTTAYGILRNQGVPLTMGDFLGDWGTT